MKKYSFIVLILSLVASHAFADTPRLSLVAGGNYSTNTDGGLGYAAGGILKLTSYLEVGALYLDRHYSFNGFSSDEHTLHVPAMLRFGSGETSLGLGGFYETNGNNYGLTGGVRFGGMMTGPFIDLRFNYGLKDDHSEDIMALVGYAF